MYMDNEWFVGAKSFSYIAYNRNYILDITEKGNDSFVISYKDGNKDEYSNYFLNQGQKDAFFTWYREGVQIYGGAVQKK